MSIVGERSTSDPVGQPQTQVGDLVWAAVRAAAQPHAVATVTVEGEPGRKERPRTVSNGGKSHTFTPKQTKAAERRVATALRAAMPDWCVDATSTFGVLIEVHLGSSHWKDIDNLVKVVLDAGNGVVWADDRQVDTELSRVFRGAEHPHTEILIYFAGQLPVPAGRSRSRTKALGSAPIPLATLRRVFAYIVMQVMAGRHPTAVDIATKTNVGLSAPEAEEAIAQLLDSGCLRRAGGKFTVVRGLPSPLPHSPMEGHRS
jgi:Holliday junction resolvase RusA-like endonuclease